MASYNRTSANYYSVIINIGTNSVHLSSIVSSISHTIVIYPNFDQFTLIMWTCKACAHENGNPDGLYCELGSVIPETGAARKRRVVSPDALGDSGRDVGDGGGRFCGSLGQDPDGHLVSAVALGQSSTRL